MITSTHCRDFSQPVQDTFLRPNTSEDRAYLLRNIAKSFAGVAGQFELLPERSRRYKVVKEGTARSPIVDSTGHIAEVAR
ncbi:hypothetical protein ACVWZ6_007058 [Bradyrhizobium sp. GM6.1]